MSTSKHTPGPWVPVELRIGSRSFWIAISAEGKLPETEANARLKAAAPDMLAMLRECRATFALAVDGDDDPGNAIVAEIDAVLAKAGA